jgi:nickel-dependent lactate racemase
VDIAFFPYGKGDVALPCGALNVLGKLNVAVVPHLVDPIESIRHALEFPINSPNLRAIVEKGDKVAVIVNDDTRVANTSFFLPFLLSEIEAGGVDRNNISIVFANGTHKLLSMETQKHLLGEEIFNNYKIVNHDCNDKKNLVFIGETTRGNKVEINRSVAEADKVVLTGSIVYHFFAGYGGGRKALVPGVAGYNTILFNHRLMLEDGATLGRLRGNPVHEDLMEAVELLKPHFLMNAVLNENKEFLGFFAGDYIMAHEEGCKLVDSAYSATITQTADIVIASCGGYPKDINLYQAQKTLDNAVRAVSPGGVIILLASCPEGLGSVVLEEWLDKYLTPAEIHAALKKNFELGGHKAYALTRLTEKAHIIMVSDISPEIVKKIHYTPASDINEALCLAVRHIGYENPTIYLMPQGSLVLPRLR